MGIKTGLPAIGQADQTTAHSPTVGDQGMRPKGKQRE